ncbi:MAG: phage portal protein [bacterium]|nr:phage portal protein [bacterium]
MAWNLSKRSSNLKQYDDWKLLSNLPSSDSEETVGYNQASKITTVFNCLNVLAQDVATLPLTVKRETANGKETVKNSNIYTIIHDKPNPWMNAWQFWFLMVFLGEGRGNSYAYIKRDSNMQVEALWPLDPSKVEPIKDSESGEWFYKVGSELFEPWEIFHYRSFTTNGVQGISKILWNASQMGIHVKQRKFKNTSISNRPPGFLAFEKSTQEQRKDSRDSWEKDLKSGRTPVLFGEVDYKQLMITPEAADIVQSEKWTDTQTIGIWRMNPVMISNHEKSTYSNTEQQGIAHVKFTLMPILKIIEQEINNKLFPESNSIIESPLYARFNPKGLMRGDLAAQTEWFRLMLTTGVYNANTVLDLDDMPHQKGDLGDKYLVQGAYVDKSQLDEVNNQQARNLREDIEKLFKKHHLNGHKVEDQ